MADNVIQLKITIDNKDATASLKLTDENIKELYKSFKYGQQEVNGFITSISQGFNNAREIIIGFKEAFNVISNAFSTHITAYQSQEGALIKLNTALAQSGNLTDGNVKSLVDYSAELQRTTIYGDEVTQTVMAQLMAMGLTVEQTKKATLQAANLATIMGTDLNGAARAMADLFNGNAGMIGRYIKGLDETIIKSGDLDKIMAMLNERIGGQAEAMGRSAAGQIARMNNAIGDLKENTGQLLSKALAPFINSISDIIAKLNNLSPGLSGVIGLIGSMTTAFITLRVTGILPAIKSVELFGVALTGLRATLVKTGIGALIVALGYGLYELAKAYEHFVDVSSQGEKSYNNVLDHLRSQAVNAKKEELDWMLSDAEKSRDKLKADLEKLKTDIQAATTTRRIIDKEGNEFFIQQETEKSKALSSQLKQTEQLLKLEEDKIKIYGEVKNRVVEIKNLTQEEINVLFEKNKTELAEQQRHQQSMLKIETDNDLILLGMKIKHFDEMIELHRKYNQNVTPLLNQRAELEAELSKKIKPPEIELPDTLPYEPAELADIQYGNMLDYARLSKIQELELWRKTELEKASIYENSAEVITAIEEEYKRRREDIRAEEALATSDIYAQMFQNLSVLFGQHTAAYKAMAIAQTIIETYKAATAALSPPPVGAGPLLGPILAITTLAAGLANAQRIASTKIPGFQFGGRLKKGEAGFIEGLGNEIIAPEKTFIEIFRQELRPHIYGNMSLNNSAMLSELRALRRELSNGGIRAVAYLDDREAKRIVSSGSYLRRKSVL